MLTVVFVVMAAMLLTMSQLSDDRLWAMRSWQYRDPEPHRPSPTAFRTQKTLCLLAGLVGLALGVYTLFS